jgi:hypothetical protein
MTSLLAMGLALELEVERALESPQGTWTRKRSAR